MRNARITYIEKAPSVSTYVKVEKRKGALLC